ncbi:LacI family DNA-binding transcriptional regulator [Herbiconiux flava]|uniref:LacI family transcriptional regulator n=1 Tax=Herbiconiux flava TaxID=881268 RepID=A0A852SLI8_9MICO|nr:LacI family DNA-binding transcriptional regulator [Herbiconiux flava]NYD69841.1 LacI family transcriptional regulator [Herbiconiux flava]GLK16590.1 LacI family transcriptional regulator [Herbiconiux flava]
MDEVGIRDVAALAGVSVSTVSNALNRPELVSRKAATRVAEAIAELDYVPNVAARQLRAGRSNAIGMAVLNITNPFFSDVVLGAEEVAEEAGYSVIVGNSYDSVDREARYLSLFEQQRLDGVLIAPVGESIEMLDRFRRRGVPVVLIDRVDTSGVLPSISLDDVLGGRLAAKLLVEGGARHLAFIGGPLRVPQMRERLRGCREIVEAAGARFTFIETSTLNPQLGREIGDRLSALPSGERPDGIFAGNDHVALGVLQSLISHGISVPGEVSIVGYDDIDFASAAVVPLTTVRQPSHDMGGNAARLLLGQLTDRHDPGLRIRFDPVLVTRQTTR